MDEKYHRKASHEHYQKHKNSYLERNKQQRIRNRAIINEAKKNGCSQCPETFLQCLEFHHPCNDKDLGVGEMLLHGVKRLREEIAKCVVLCANCHRKEHYKE
jgi:hypothetical protein